MAVVCLLISAYVGRNLETQRGQVGIRFPEDVINGEQLEELKQAYESDRNVGGEPDKSDKKEPEEFPDITLWRQNKEGTVSDPEDGLRKKETQQEVFRQEIKQSGTKCIQVKVIEVWGDVEQIYPGRLMAGAAISKEDEAGCMLSKEAAFDLFGAVDILDKEVLYEGKIYQVRGILDLEEEVFLREDQQVFCSFLEVQESPGEGVEQLRQILSPAGISLEAGAVLEWDMICWILGMVRTLALGILLFGGIRWIGKEWGNDATSRGYGRHRVFLWCLRIVVLLILFLLMKENWCLSQDYIPARWSDFEFFGELFQRQKENYLRYLDMADIWKDRKLFTEICWTLGWIAASVVCGCGWIRSRD